MSMSTRGIIRKEIRAIDLKIKSNIPVSVKGDIVKVKKLLAPLVGYEDVRYFEKCIDRARDRVLQSRGEKTHTEKIIEQRNRSGSYKYYNTLNDVSKENRAEFNEFKKKSSKLTFYVHVKIFEVTLSGVAKLKTELLDDKDAVFYMSKIAGNRCYAVKRANRTYIFTK